MPANNSMAGWGFFGGSLLAIQGAAQVVMGISELGQQKLFFILGNPAVTHSTFVVWGWISVVLGVLLLIAGLSALHESAWSRMAGILFAGLALLASLVFLPVYALWAVLAAVVSTLTMYALAVR
jgi:hypothetical protein